MNLNEYKPDWKQGRVNAWEIEKVMQKFARELVDNKSDSVRFEMDSNVIIIKLGRTPISSSDVER